MKKTLYFLVLSLFFACKSQVLPPQHPDLSERNYQDYCKNLQEARSNKNYFKEAAALANLKEPSDQVYKFLYKSIKQHDTLCYKIHEFQDNYKSAGFQVSIISNDTTKWKKLCKECEKIVPIEKYYVKKDQNEFAYKKKIAMAQIKLDTNLIDKKLIASLAKIDEKDQRIRGLASNKIKFEKWTEQVQLDSLNLFQIDAIFKAENGYPSLQKVGYDQVMTPWFVLQHQTSIPIRKKYLHYLEEAVQKGYLNKNLLENYKIRTLNHEEKEIIELNKRNYPAPKSNLAF